MQREIERELASSVGRTLREQARRNELAVAYVRTVALALAAALDTAYYLDPVATLGLDYVSPAPALLAAAWTVVAAAIAAALYRGLYHELAADALPALDGLIVISLHATIISAVGDAEIARLHPLIVVAAGSTLLAMTGALRLRHRAVWVSTGAGVVVFVLASSYITFTLVQTAFVCAIILSAGLLGGWIAGVVRNAVANEAQKIVLARFLPEELARADYAAALRLVSEPRTLDATVLVSDLRGFTGLAERQSPARTLEVLNLVQGAFADAVRAHGGTVDKFLGDGMLAVFGAPERLANHASAAVTAAHDMLERLRQLNRAQAAQWPAPLRAGIGIHSGPVVVGCLGSGARLELTVLGDTVNTASRLQAMTKEQGVALLVSEDTVKLLGEDGVSPLEPHGEMPVRGRSAPIRLYAARVEG